ncbi:hypothetical protein [Endozoicomonas ascidiicola]|uniref:hypothetical protein n=1 Tax=Endozoicomonas ascidiicola TaxID=1698521 RepID=UPI00082A5B5A|nr:hypothetical protein [Endozoicomonas ascidiicola]
MKIVNDQNNMIFDDQDSRCFMRVIRCQGQNFAFLVCLDLGWPDCRLKQPIPKRYWGNFSWDEKESSIKEIMHNGAKWDDLREAV